MKVQLNSLARVTISTAGVPVQVSSTLIIDVVSVRVTADASNTGSVYIGGSTVTSTSGEELGPNEGLEVSGDDYRSAAMTIDLTSIYVDTATNGNKVRVQYLKRV